MDTNTPLIISVPREGFTPESLDMLTKLVDSKATLITKALGTCCLTIRQEDGCISFPWWDRVPEP